MTAAITLKNLPAQLPKHIVERLLFHHHVEYQVVKMDSVQDNGELGQVAYVLLTQNGTKKILRKLNGVEVEDRIVEAENADVQFVKHFKESSRETEKPSKSKKRPSSKPSSSEYEDPSEISPAKPEVELVSFDTFDLTSTLKKNLERMGFQLTTPIQALAIPPAMEGNDIIGKAQTGTGKTLAFSLPIIEHILQKPARGLQALILTPTRELAVQINEVVEELVVDTEIKTGAIYGGEHVLDQYVRLMDDMNIMIATPGRLLDMQKRGRLRIDMAEIFVLDEADRMLDMGFLPDIQKIFNCFYEHPQTMLFSATIPKDLSKLTGVNLKDPVFIDAGAPDMAPLETVKQDVIEVKDDEKDQWLRDLLADEDGTAIIFTRTKRMTEQLYNKLKYDGYPVARIHGDIDQTVRMKAVESLKERKIRFLIATDVASRGLHIENVAHIINYDLPMTPEDHLHRIGRTARAGASGKATTLVTPKEKRYLKDFRQVFGQTR